MYSFRLSKPRLLSKIKCFQITVEKKLEKAMAMRTVND